MTDNESVPDKWPASRWLVVFAGLGMVTPCVGLAAYGVVSTLTCLDDERGYQPLVCTSTTAASWYLASLVAAGAIAVVGVAAGLLRHRLSVAGLAVLVSIGLSGATILWGVH
jgi:hypothetical protein